MTKTRTMSLAALFAALTAIGAFLQIPVGITSITLQFLFTSLAGLLLGAKWGALSQLVYVILGLVGLPVFTQGGGPGYLLQPSMGFLLGLIPGGLDRGPADGTKANSRPGDSGLPGRIGRPVRGGRALYVRGAPPLPGADMTLWAVVWSGILIYLPGRRAQNRRGRGSVPADAPGGETGINPVLVPYR